MFLHTWKSRAYVIEYYTVENGYHVGVGVTVQGKVNILMQQGLHETLS